jgi:hypothetical protein
MRFFHFESNARNFMRMKNKSRAKGHLFVLVDGPENNFCICTLKQAHELQLPYSIEY